MTADLSDALHIAHSVTRFGNSLQWLSIQQRINFKLATIIHRGLHNAGPQYMTFLLHPYTPSRQLRSASLNLLSQPRINITLASRGFRHVGPSLWNYLRSSDAYTVFKSNLKTHRFFWWNYLWPLAISIHTLLIQHNHVDL